MKQEKFDLSEKIREAFINGDDGIEVEDVKEAVRRLKDRMKYKIVFSNRQVFEFIDEIFGGKLI